MVGNKKMKILYGMICLAVFSSLPYYLRLAYEKTSDYAQTKVVLIWASHGFDLGHKPFLLHNCSVSNCELTTNRSALNYSHAVVFHHWSTDINDLPKFRREWQRWVFWLRESPSGTHPDLKLFKSFYNWTMTYRRDSDILASYGSVLPRPVFWNPGPNYTAITSKKQKLVAWMVSHCRTQSKREEYVKELAKHIPVDIYGRCGNLSCPKNDTKCQNKIFTKYKFYLSFENSLHVDYVTEKLYRVLQHDIVPVVFGGADYTALAPPKSYIDARSFKSPRHLAQYLLVLDENHGLYNEYFQWKARYVVIRSPVPFCDLCAKLNDPNQTVKWYDDIYKWWMVGDFYQ